MKTQLVTDYSGEPVAMVVDYKAWVKIAEQLHLPIEKIPTVKERNPLDWYKLTEMANSVLNGVIAYASRERRKELSRISPDIEVVEKLTSLRNEVAEANRNSLNFRSLERMEELIEKYGPILRSENSQHLGLSR
ncbi:MAG: hypothetical protein WC622_00675 [Pedobacter sp.]|jgi:hypothetical protein|uniref:hypothetical protein n=1 Tax=Pedobacter sp. TaxID=1411316 RepID=UPI003562E4E8